MTARRRRLTAGIAMSLLGLVASACGIRPTEVPTDFGPAPSREPCEVSEPATSKQSTGGVPVQVFLVCAAELVPVDRRVELPAGQTSDKDRGRVARALLDELGQRVSRAERQAGYSTEVPDGVTVSGPRGGDPDDALRLSAPAEDLSPFALAQLVCTLANSAAASRDGRVILGGPGVDPLRAYECTPEVRARPALHEPPSTVLAPGP
ncbi:hypothetical protein ACFV0R_06365 [Streptomyces sp. NPDC059578]|uniref:hypothetical protein n=1 Tax=Streptomyces sp. NPDC059578 TaxID=3346874 RepID=UPI0036958EE6